jgi:hypothetical protein
MHVPLAFGDPKTVHFLSAQSASHYLPNSPYLVVVIIFIVVVLVVLILLLALHIVLILSLKIEVIYCGGTSHACFAA